MVRVCLLLDAARVVVLPTVPVRIGQTDTPWAVLITLPRSAVTSVATADMWRQIGIGTLLAIVAVALIVWMAVRLVAPVKALSEVAQRVTAGDLDQSIEVTSADEMRGKPNDVDVAMKYLTSTAPQKSVHKIAAELATQKLKAIKEKGRKLHVERGGRMPQPRVTPKDPEKMTQTEIDSELDRLEKAGAQIL